MTVVLIAVVVGGSAASFVWFMNRQQAQAGTRLRAAAATGVAEAGVHRALAVLESAAPDGQPGRAWRAQGHTEQVPVGPLAGSFTLRVDDGPGGSLLATSVGEVGGVARRLRARVVLASPALLAALYGAGLIHLEGPPGVTIVRAYGAGPSDYAWIHMAAGRGIRLATTDVSLNDPAAGADVGPGPVDRPGGDQGTPSPARPEPIRLMLPDGAEVQLDRAAQPVTAGGLRAAGVNLADPVRTGPTLPRPPEVDRSFYQGLALANVANAELNEAAGDYAGDRELARKRDSLYSSEQFARMLGYLKTGRRPPRLRGIIYVRGGLAIVEGQRLEIAEGALIAEGTVHLAERAALEITHSAATRTLPGLIVLGRGALVITHEARLRVHGLVYAARTVDLGAGARLDVVGAVLSRDAHLSFRNVASQAVIRYDPAVMGTPGLIAADDTPALAVVTAWEELP